jgi:hypothetical protein
MSREISLSGRRGTYARRAKAQRCRQRSHDSSSALGSVPHFYPRHMYLASALCIAQATLAAALIAFT